MPSTSRRPEPYPPIHIRIDEATNAGLVGRPELKGIAETNKNGLYWDFYVQNLDFPGGADAVLQNCHHHEWFGCPFYELARKGATDVAAGLKLGDRVGLQPAQPSQVTMLAVAVERRLG